MKPRTLPAHFTVHCAACDEDVVLDERAYTVRHHPAAKGEKREVAPAPLGDPLPFDPHHDKFIIEFVCPQCGETQTTEVE